jgi:chromosome partitioning protein
VIFRSLFPTGMTVFDPLDEDLLGGLPSMSHMSARQEYRSLVAALHLPTTEIAAERQALTAPEETDPVRRFIHMMQSDS